MTQDDKQPWTVLRVLNWTAQRFSKTGLESSRLDAEILIAHALGVERIRLYLDHDKPLRSNELITVRDFIRRRLSGEPVAYIVGVKEFHSLRLNVDPQVLIPRPETELLVEIGSNFAKHWPAPTIVDVGTGSGAVAIAIARECPNAIVYAIEKSNPALDRARANALLHQVHITFLEGNLLDPLPETLRPNVIVANLPYIPSLAIEALSKEVRDHEPRIALDGGIDGLEIFRRLIPSAATRLDDGGRIALEIGWDQGSRLTQLLAEHGFIEIELHRDWSGLDRVISAAKLHHA